MGLAAACNSSGLRLRAGATLRAGPGAAGAARSMLAITPRPRSIELLQVHARIQLADLRLVAVEQQRRTLLREQPVFADAAFGRLAPARMVDVRIHVRIEAVLVAC